MEKVKRSDMLNGVRCDSCGCDIPVGEDGARGYCKFPPEDKKQIEPGKKICKNCYDKLSKDVQEKYSSFPRQILKDEILNKVKEIIKEKTGLDEQQALERTLYILCKIFIEGGDPHDISIIEKELKDF